MASDINGAARHTPGPWKVAGPFRSDAYGWRINEVRIKDRHGEDDVAVIGYDFTDDDAKAAVMADAALIAAAPELLAALQVAECVIRYAAQEATGRVDREKVGGWIHHADQLRAAIAKARQGGGA